MERPKGAARMTEGDFQLLIEHSPDCLVISRGGQIVYANPRMKAVLGHEDEGLLGQPLSFIVHSEERRSLERFAEQGAAYQYSPRLFRLQGQAGEAVIVEMLQFPVSYDGEAAVVLVARDITERQQLLARAVQMDRTIAVGALAAGVSHEINNPLAFVSANLEYALYELEWFEQQVEAGGLTGERGAAMRGRLMETRQALIEAREGADRVRGVVSDLRLLARGAEGRPRAISPARVLDSAIQLTRNEFKHRGRVERSYAPTPPVVVDEGRLSQVFLNLLLNAAQALPEGDFNAHRVEARIYPEGGAVIIEIEDTGCGVPMGLEARIFEPFFSTKPLGMGTGMGLSLSKDIVEGLGGQLSLAPTTFGGACFRVRLPSGLAGEATPLPSDLTPALRRRGQILIIDDEPLVGRSLRRMLSDEHDAQAVSTAQAALELIQGGLHPDIILCDVMMPEMGAEAFYGQLREARPQWLDRVIFMTGEAFTPEARAFIDSVGNLCLDKPLAPERIRKAIRKILESVGPTVVPFKGS